MAQYKVGTASIENGSAALTGIGTKWEGNVSPGWMFFIVGDTAFYQISSVNSNTSITLTTTYADVTRTSVSYAIVRDYTYFFQWPVVVKGNSGWALILEEALRMIDANLNATPANRRIKSITFEPQDSSPTIQEGKIYYDNGKNAFLYWSPSDGWQQIVSTAI